MAKKTAFDELKAWVGEDYLRDNATNVRAENPSFPFPEGFGEEDDSDDIEEEIDDADTPSPDSDSDEWWEAELGKVWANDEQLKQVERARREADRLSHIDPDDIEAARQKYQQQLADEVEKQRRIALQAGGDALGRASDTVNAVTTRIASMPTPGGIGMLLIVLLILLAVLIPVNGQPRLVWLWLVLTRKAGLKDEQTVAAEQSNTSAEAIANAIIAGAEIGINGALPGVGTVVGSVVSGGTDAGIIPSYSGTDINSGFGRYIH